MNRKKIYNAFSLYALIFILLAIWFYFSSSFVFATETDSKEVSDQVITEETQEPEVFEEPEKYNIQSMDLKASEVAEVEDGGTAGNDLFDFEAFIKESDVTDGTAPFDADNQAGNDSGDKNGIVRTFDTVTYPIKITVNPKNVDKLNNIVLKITGTLKNGVTNDRVNGKFSVGGYENIETGTVGFEQTYTIVQTGNSIMIPISIDIQGAENGIELTPDIDVEVISVDGKNIENDNVKMAFDNLKTFKTSGKVNIKPILNRAFDNQRTLTRLTGAESNDFVYGVSVSFGLENLPGKTDSRGSTFPVGKINYHVELSGKVMWDQRAAEALNFTGRDKPVTLFDYQPIMPVNKKVGNINSTMEGLSYTDNHPYFHAAKSKIIDYNNPTNIQKNSDNSVWDSGTYKFDKSEVSKSIVKMNGSVSDYTIGSTFPLYRSDTWRGYTIYGVNDKVFSTQGVLFQSPNEYRQGGKNNPDNESNNVYYYFKFDVDSYEDSKGVVNKVNKTTTVNMFERNDMNGSMSVNNTFFSINGRDLGSSVSGDNYVSTGDPSVLLGEDVSFNSYTLVNMILYGGYTTMYKWNTDSFELTKTYADQTKNRMLASGYSDKNGVNQNVKTSNKQIIYYGVPKNTDMSFKKLTKYTKDDYTWYDTYDKARDNGVVGAILDDIKDVTGVGVHYNQISLHVKTQKMGTLNEKGTENIALTSAYGYGDENRSKPLELDLKRTYNNQTIYNSNLELETLQSPVGSSVNYETLAILNAEVASVISADKATYYNSEEVGWTVKSSILLPSNSGMDSDGGIQIKQVLPKGLDYKAGSGMQGTTGKEPKITQNADGTKTLIWDLLVSNTNTKIDTITFKTTINPFALSSGVQSSLAVKNIISSSLDTRSEKLRTSSKSINVLKVGMVGIYENIDKQYGEKNSVFTLTLQPYTTIEEENDVKGITILPQNKDKKGSLFSGSAILKKLAISGDNKVSLYLNNNVVETSDPHKIDLTKNGWTKYTGAGQNISNTKTVLFHVEGVLANDDNVEIKLDIQTKDNEFGDVYLNETVINSATDYKLSPISNKVRYTIQADVELNLERIQIFTANHNKGLPVKVRINKDIIKKESINETIKLVIYEKEKNKKIYEKKYVVSDLLRENELIIPSEFLEKDNSKSYEVRIEEYNMDRVYVLEGAGKIDTKGYTASERNLEVKDLINTESPKTLDYKGVIMTEREIGKEVVEFYETLTLPLLKLKPVKSGYGIDLNQKVSYSNELNNLNEIKARILVNSKLIDTYLELYKEGNNSIIELSSEEVIITGNTIQQKLTLPKVFVEDKTGFLFSEDQVLNKDTRIKHKLQDGGNKLYTPIWIKELGSYGVNFQNLEPIGANEVTFDIADTVDINAYMYATIGSETIQEDELLIQPIYPDSTKPKNWSKEELKWLIK